jgi:hypothetical protein
MVNDPVVLPLGMVTEAGDTVAIEVELDASATVVPWDGAGALRVTVPVVVCPTPTPAGTVNEMLAVPMLTVVVPGRYPLPLARMFVKPAARGVTVTVALVEPEGIVTLDGIEMTFGSNPEKLTTNPLGPAAGLTFTVRVPGALSSKFSGFGVSVIFISLAVIVTVIGALLRIPLLTISCAMYVPGMSAINVGETEDGDAIDAVLPCGTWSSDQK